MYFTNYYNYGSVKRDGLDGQCSTHDLVEKYYAENLKLRAVLRELSIRKRIILISILK